MKNLTTETPRSNALGHVDFDLLARVPAYKRKGVAIKEIDKFIEACRPQIATARVG